MEKINFDSENIEDIKNTSFDGRTVGMFLKDNVSLNTPSPVISEKSLKVSAKMLVRGITDCVSDSDEQIKGDMDTFEIVSVMSEGNPGAMHVAIQMLDSPRGFLDILLCDSLNIRGSKLYMLFNDCCRKDTNKFSRTLMMLRAGIFSKEEIHANLEQVYAMPFIDDSIKIENIPPYGSEFGPTNKEWKRYCDIQKEAFKAKIAPLLDPGTTKKIER